MATQPKIIPFGLRHPDLVIELHSTGEAGGQLCECNFPQALDRHCFAETKRFLADTIKELEQLEPKSEDEVSSPQDQVSHFHVSQDIIVQSSPVWKMCISSGGRYKSLDTIIIKGQETKILPLFDPVSIESLEIVLNILHCRSRRNPKSISFHLLRDIAVLTDKYDLVRALGEWPEAWVEQLLCPTGVTRHEITDAGHEDWLFIAKVFYHLKTIRRTRVIERVCDILIRDISFVDVENDIILRLDRKGDWRGLLKEELSSYNRQEFERSKRLEFFKRLCGSMKPGDSYIKDEVQVETTLIPKKYLGKVSKLS